MRDGDRHVVPNPGGGWDVKAEKAKRASSHHETQAEAVERAREIIRNKGGGELTVHGEDGRVRQKDTVAAAAPANGAGAASPARATATAPQETKPQETKPQQAKPQAAAPADRTGEVASTLRGDGGLAATQPLPG
ncbi:MAG: DUF2188 domain-containing protein, partial [Mycobacteriales bacterium]